MAIEMFGLMVAAWSKSISIMLARFAAFLTCTLFAGHTLDSLGEQLAAEGLTYVPSQPRFTRSKLYAILRDRSYIGEIQHQGQWYRGTHEPLIDRTTWDRVQVLLGEKIYQSHELTYGGEVIVCGACGHPITGEWKTKQTKNGPNFYTYYRCSRYNASDHPRVRLTESQIDEQVLGLFDRMRIEKKELRDWFVRVLRARTQQDQRAGQERVSDLNRQLSSQREQQDRLLNLRLLEEIDSSTFAKKSTEIRDSIANLSLQIEACDRSRAERSELAEKVFELSQALRDKWLASDVRAKRQLLKIVCLNWTLDGVTLIPSIRKPFDVLVEGLTAKISRGDRI